MQRFLQVGDLSRGICSPGPETIQLGKTGLWISAMLVGFLHSLSFLGALVVSPVFAGFGEHFLYWLGSFHVIIVYFPLALLLAAAAGEAWFAWRSAGVPAPAVRFCVLLGAAGAVVAAVLGWIHAAGGNGAGSPSLLAWHRWSGTATGAGAGVLAVLSEVDSRRGVRSGWFRFLLFLVAPLVSVAGYFGGSLVYGEDFFRW